MTFYAITWIDTPANPTMEPHRRGPVLVRRERDTLIWSSGGHMDWPHNAEVLKTYRIRDMDRAYLAFHRDYPPLSTAPSHSAGWIAPTGAFYPCESWQHDSLAERLTAVHHGTLAGTRHLERLGWLRLHHNGVIGWYSDRTITQAQRDMIFDLSQVGPDDWRSTLRQILDLY